MYLSVIIPAYNEEKRIRSTLLSVDEYLSKQPYDYEIIVIDNNSKDGTSSVVQEMQQKVTSLKLIHQPMQGKGHAVAKGMLEAVGNHRLFMDADNSTTIDHLEKMLPFFNQGYKVVIGSIAVEGAKILQGGGEPWWRALLGKLGNKWIQVLAVWGINDTQRGFKIFTAQAVQDIFPRLTIFGWGFDVEVLALARKFDYKIKEAPVTWKNAPESKVNVWAYPQVLWQTLRVRLNLWTGKYK